MFGFTLTNMTEGGDGFVSNGLTDEQRAKLSEARKKIVVEYDINGNVVNEFESLTFASEATGLERKRLNHSVLNKKKLCDGRMFRYKSQKISLEDVRLAFETRNKEKRKPVLQFDLSGNLISEYKSASHTPFNATNSQKSAIAKACRGDYKTRYGFIWKYKN